MNSEEIKEIGQMFLNISNQNHSMNLGLTDEDVIKGVISKIKDDLAYPDWQALEKSEEMLSKQTDLLGERVLTLEKEALKIRKFQDDTHNKIRILYDGSWKKSDVDKQLNKLRKDYRDLQDEMWNRFKLIEDWIRSDTRREKDTLKAEII